MNSRPTRHVARSVAALLGATLLVSSVAACGSNQAATKTGPMADAAAAPTSTAPPNTAPPNTAPPGTSAPTGGGVAYASVINNEVVDNPKLDEFEKATKARMTKAGLPGASLLVVQHGKVVEQEAWMGYTLDTVVPIASGSKWLTAATIMTLVDEGKIDLDAPISSYLDYAKGDVGTITMRQLLSLTSGLADDESFPCTEDPTITLDACNQEIAKAKLVHEPGAAFRYGGQHMHMAASVAEAVTGTQFADLFIERIATPLGMTNTRFLNVKWDQNAPIHPGPAGTAVSTLGDYGRFLEMIVHDGVAPDGTRILESATLAEMQRNQIGDAEYKKAASFRMTEKNPYGLGEWLEWVGPDGEAIVLGSDGAFGFRPWIDRQNDIYGVYLVDDHTGNGYVEGDPRASSDDGGKVHTSGNWVFADVAAALGGSLPKDKNPASSGR